MAYHTIPLSQRVARLDLKAARLKRDIDAQDCLAHPAILKYRAAQLRVPAGQPDGGQWAPEGGADGLIKPVFLQQTFRLGAAAERALGAYRRLQNGAGQAVATFTARGFDIGDDGHIIDGRAEALTRDDVDRTCPRFVETQARADASAKAVRSETYGLSPQAEGTAIHARMKKDIDSLKDRNYIAEQSYLKVQVDNDNIYGRLNSIRIDVLEQVNAQTVCIYDIKTGASGLSAARISEIITTAKINFPSARRFVMTEIRTPR